MRCSPPDQEAGVSIVIHWIPGRQGVQEVQEEGLWVAEGGQVPPHPGQLDGGAGAHQVLLQLCYKFRCWYIMSAAICRRRALCV